MKLVVVHYHWHPGGVRRVLESGLPAVVRDPWLPPDHRVDDVVFVAGEAPPGAWEKWMRESLEDTARVSFVVEPALGYVEAWGGGGEVLKREADAAAARVLAGPHRDTVVLLENPAVGRNLLSPRAFAIACAHAGARLLCHHHDFFFDGRWARWPEIEACGLTSVAEALAAAVPRGDHIRHVAINERDATWLAGSSASEAPGGRAIPIWPNPVAVDEASPADAWLRQRLRTDAPIWLLPCRLLRRKNIAESLLLSRLIAPAGTVIVTTGGTSSAAERPYADALNRAIGEHRWPLHLAVLNRTPDEDPSVAALMRASQAVVMSSLFEGFGLPAHEAALLGVPVLARNEAVAGEWRGRSAGYDEVWIDRHLLDWPAELAAQQRLFHRWRNALPGDVAPLMRPPWWWHPDAPVPFSRLTLTGQIDLLARWVEGDTIHALADLNPWVRMPLETGGGAIVPQQSGILPWGPAFHHATPEGFAAAVRESLALMRSASVGPAPAPPVLTADRLALANHYPLLWAPET